MAENGMMTKVWGSAAWLFLHCVTFGYPEIIDVTNPEHLSKMEIYYRFFVYIGQVLPCKFCRESYQKFMSDLPLDNYMGSRKDLSYWLYMIHEKVNDKLSVPDCERPTFEEVAQQYESYRAKCKKTTDEEQNTNKIKGCLIAKNGISSKSIIKIVPNPDPTLPATQQPASKDYLLIKKRHIFSSTYTFIIILLLLSVIYKNIYYITTLLLLLTGVIITVDVMHLY